jgi:TonB family protein
MGNYAGRFGRVVSVIATFRPLALISSFSWHNQCVSRPLCFISTLALHPQAPTRVDVDTPTVVKFVAPAYPRAAKDKRIMGKTTTRMSVGIDGSVKELKTVMAHPVFESYVLEALKQWQFKPDAHEYTLEITCFFELDQANCEGTDLHPIISETHVSAELPSVVHIRTGLQCIERVDR